MDVTERFTPASSSLGFVGFFLIPTLLLNFTKNSSNSTKVNSERTYRAYINHYMTVVLTAPI